MRFATSMAVKKRDLPLHEALFGRIEQEKLIVRQDVVTAFVMPSATSLVQIKQHDHASKPLDSNVLLASFRGIAGQIRHLGGRAASLPAWTTLALQVEQTSRTEGGSFGDVAVLRHLQSLR